MTQVDAARDLLEATYGPGNRAIGTRPWWFEHSNSSKKVARLPELPTQALCRSGSRAHVDSLASDASPSSPSSLPKALIPLSKVPASAEASELPKRVRSQFSTAAAAPSTAATQSPAWLSRSDFFAKAKKFQVEEELGLTATSCTLPRTNRHHRTVGERFGRPKPRRLNNLQDSSSTPDLHSSCELRMEDSSLAVKVASALGSAGQCWSGALSGNKEPGLTLQEACRFLGVGGWAPANACPEREPDDPKASKARKVSKAPPPPLSSSSRFGSASRLSSTRDSNTSRASKFEVRVDSKATYNAPASLHVEQLACPPDSLDVLPERQSTAERRRRGSLGLWRRSALAKVPMAEDFERAEAAKRLWVRTRTAIVEEVDAMEDDAVNVGTPTHQVRDLLMDALSGGGKEGPAEEPARAKHRALAASQVVSSGSSNSVDLAASITGAKDDAQRAATPLSMVDESGLLRIDLKWQRVEHLCLDGGYFNDAEVDAMRMVFRRFQEPGITEVRKDDLEELVQYLGYVMTGGEEVRQLADEITPYNDLDFDDFIRFVEKYAAEECRRFRRFFDDFDADRSGQISVRELRKLMCTIGFMPSKMMVNEALDVVDEDGNNELNFREFVHFLTVYRHAQGFTKAEVADFRRVFESFCEGTVERGRGLPRAAMAKALIQAFGLQVEENAIRICRRLLKGGMRAHHLKMTGSLTWSEAREQDLLEFPEFLIFARRLKEAEQARYHVEFKKHDHNGDGTITIPELQEALLCLEHEPMRGAIVEVLGEVDFESNGELDVEEFFNFMMIYRFREGFTRTELEELRQVFIRFDEDHSDTMNVHELGDMLRYMGYMVGVDDLHLLIAGVDIDRSGDLDFREYLRLMRLHRKQEIKRLRAEFKKYASADLLHKDRIPLALSSALGGSVPRMLIQVLPQLLVQALEGRNADKQANGATLPNMKRRTSIQEAGSTVADLSDKSKSFMKRLMTKINRRTAKLEARRSFASRHTDLATLQCIEDAHRGDLLLVVSDVAEIKRCSRESQLRPEDDQRRSMAAGSTVTVLEKDLETKTVLVNSPLHGDLWFGLCSLVAACGELELIESLSETLSAATTLRDSGGIDLDGFVELADLGRSLRVSWERMHAGFTDADIHRFQQLFAVYDADKSGVVDEKELLSLLGSVGVECKTREEQQMVLSRLGQARQKAKEAGVEILGERDASEGVPGRSHLVTFWEFVQLMRLIRDWVDRENEETVKEVSKEVHFSWQEVAQFREVFIHWSRREHAGEAKVILQATPMVADLPLLDHEAPLGEHIKDGLCPHTFYCVVRSLGITMTFEQEKSLDRELVKHLTVGPSKMNQPRDQLDFVGFLRMMRWLLDSDFARINRVAADTAALHEKAASVKPW